jgi:hypothetical protein
MCGTKGQSAVSLNRTLCVVLAWALSAAPSSLRAQAAATTGDLRGTVVTDSTNGLAGASLNVVELGRTTLSGDGGRFQFSALPAGTYTLIAQRLGFEAAHAEITIQPGRVLEIDVELQRIAQRLTGMTVRSEASVPGVVLAIRTRNAGGQGTVIERTRLESARGTSVAQFMATQVHGVRSVQYSAVGATILASTRGSTAVGSQEPAADPADPHSPRGCFLQVFVDGVRLYAPAAGAAAAPDLSRLDVGALEAIEYYAGPATTPTEYSGTGAQCGTVALWTRAR